jgi:hypothetical protein
MTGSRYARLRASAMDTDRTLEVLKTGFTEGRLTKDELDRRLEQAFLARFFDELVQITADLPVGFLGRLPAFPPGRELCRSSGWRTALGTAAVALGAFLIFVAALATLAAA